MIDLAEGYGLFERAFVNEFHEKVPLDGYQVFQVRPSHLQRLTKRFLRTITPTS